MTVLTATAPVNLNTLTLIGGFLTAVSGSSNGPNSFVIGFSPYEYRGTGLNLNYGSNNEPQSGTLATLEIWNVSGDDTHILTLSGMAIDIANVRLAPFNVITFLFGGVDTLNGSANQDFLFGFGGKDTIKGNGGPDTLTGGVGPDILNGGPSFDYFDYNNRLESPKPAPDTIQGFNHGQGDKIDLRTIDATPGGANNPFKFIGAQALAAYNATHAGGVVRAVMGKIEIDIGGNNSVDMVIKTPGVLVVGGDFFL